MVDFLASDTGDDRDGRGMERAGGKMEEKVGKHQKKWLFMHFFLGFWICNMYNKQDS